ncbi:MAG: hypothetical protein IJP53_01715 [Synergistaceae bacterium]|nr:hypothetical protein [Synergistaceae bacterium]
MPKMLYVTEEMISRAGNIGANASDILSSQNQVTGIFQNMGRDFSGKIPALMTEKMIAMESDYQNINSILNGYKEFLEDSARNIVWTDEQAAQWAKALGH